VSRLLIRIFDVLAKKSYDLGRSLRGALEQALAGFGHGTSFRWRNSKFPITRLSHQFHFVGID